MLTYFIEEWNILQYDLNNIQEVFHFEHCVNLWCKYRFPPKPLLQIFPCKNPSKIMIITSHMQKIIQIYPCLLKLSRKQDTILKICDFSTKNKDFPPKPLLQIFPCKNPSKIMIITSHMQNIQIYPCLLKLSRKQDTILKICDFSTKN